MLPSGDRPWIDSDACMHFLARSKDAMRRPGETISPYELESVVNRHKSAVECAGAAVPSPVGKDGLRTVVVVKPGDTLNHKDVCAFFDENMPRFQERSRIEIGDALPKTPNQKFLKYQIRGQGMAGDREDREAVPVSHRA